MDNVWSVSKCKRVLRPLISNIHSVSELFESYPANSIFEIDRFVALCLEGNDERTRLMYPENSMSRLHSLKAFISPDLYTRYRDVFVSLRTVLIAIALANPTLSMGGSMPLLSSLCCFLYGRSMAMKSKTSYYQLNNRILFENDDEDFLDDSNEGWADEIDTWLELEPFFLIEPKRANLLLGYVVHLLILHLERLSPLMIVLVQQVYETSPSPFYRITASKLFHEYWEFMSTSKSESVQHQFVSLLDSGYWAAYLPVIDAKSANINSNDPNCNYSALILDAVPLNDLKLGQMEQHLRRCVGHKRSNLILVSVLSGIVEETRIGFRKNQDELVNASVIRDVRRFLTVWLDNSNSPQVYDSLQIGNEDIFAGLVRLVRYAKRRAEMHCSASVVSQLIAYEQAILVLGCFYLGMENTNVIESVDDLEVCSQLIASVHGSARIVENPLVIDLIEWLVYVDKRKFAQLACWIFKQQFGVNLYYWDHLAAQLYQYLKIELESTLMDIDAIFDSDDEMLVVY